MQRLKSENMRGFPDGACPDELKRLASHWIRDSDTRISRFKEKPKIVGIYLGISSSLIIGLAVGAWKRWV